MFQFRAFPSYDYFIHRTILRYCLSGFPHSEISGSMLICSSPKLIAACRVLHRLLMPRHSPCALFSLTYGLLVLLAFLQNYAGNSSEEYFEIVSTLNYLKFHNIFAFCSQRFRAVPSVALLLSSSSLFSFQGAVSGVAPVVEISGFEPLTPCLQSRCSPS